VPEGTTAEQLLGKLQLAGHPGAQSLLQSLARKQTLGDMSGMQKFNAGMGLAFQNIGRGAKQLVGGQSDYAENKDIDRALMHTGAGAAGNVAGNIAAFAPLAVIPGANTVAGAGALGATAGALQPAEGVRERLTNMGVGGALGAGTQALAGPVAQRLGERAAERQAELAMRKSQNEVFDETTRLGREAGYVVPPSATSNTWLGRRLEGVAGKAAIGQEAAIRNQDVTDRLAREAAGLQEHQPLSLTNLRGARYQMAQPYRDVAALSPQAARDLESLQQARFDAKMAWKEFNRQGVRSAYNDAQRAEQNAARLTQNIENYAQQAGQPDLVKALVEARKRIAQNRQVQEALNRGTGSIDASVIGRALDNNAPLEGNLATIGRFQQAYKPYMREASTVPTPGVSKTEALSSALLGAAGAGATGSPKGWFAAGLPLVSGPTRSALLSGPVQDVTMAPSYSAGPVTNATAALADPETRRRAALLARALGLSMIPSATPANE